MNLDGKINGKGAYFLVETPVNENTVVDPYTYDRSEYYYVNIDVGEFVNGQWKDGGTDECIKVELWDNKLDLNSELYN